MTDSQRFVLRTVVVIGQTSADGPNVRSPLHAICRKVVTAEDVAAARPLVEQADADLVIVSESIPAPEALAFLESLRGSPSELPVVVVSARSDVDLAVRFIRAGAYDFIEAPLVGDRLERVVAAGKAAAGLSRKKDRFFSPDCPAGVGIVGHSDGIVETLQTLRLVAESNCDPVLILGETGTGKELVARAVHRLRSGANGKLVAINCAALTASLLESELFGHVKGAFTGADREKTGLFELAGDGTIFLDEISEMARALQPKLLRVLQEKTFRKVGGTKDICCKATIIASSNRDLFKEAEQGTFRKDLYYRLAVFPITVPPLRSERRCSDIPLLAEYFIETSSISTRSGVQGLSAAAGEALLRHTWPGNVRELKNVVDRALILERANEITLSSLMIERDGQQEAPAATPAARKDFSLEAAEREFIIRALKETGWQRTRAAALLGISRATLHAKLNRYDIKAPGGQSRAANREPSDLRPSAQRGSSAACEGDSKLDKAIA